MKKVNKISIIGGPGTGKTTLTNFLSNLLNLPKYHIDGIHHLENWEIRDKTERDNIIFEIIQKKEWIIDGTYRNTLEERVRKSDLVIFLDYSDFIKTWSVLKRIILNFNKEKEEIPGCRERFSLEFLMYILRYNKTYRSIITNVLEKYDSNKIIVFKNRKELNKWLRKIEEGFDQNE